jgi:uncharacterized membrane protein YqaE (UPF0057 family)
VEPGAQTLVALSAFQIPHAKKSTLYFLTHLLLPEDFFMDNKLVLIIIAIFLPPVAVFLKKGVGKDLVINILLTLLIFFPGMVHALWITTK